MNDQQKKAVTAPLGPVLVLAGPGSGKTKTLTHRIAYIIEKKLVQPQNILALTFTNKAAGEMRQRLVSLLARYKGAAESATMGTFHAVSARILRKEISSLGYGHDFVIYGTDDQQKTLKEICEDLQLDTKRFPVSLFAALISRAKNMLQLPAELNLGLESPLRERLAEVYGRYQDSLYKQNGLDFDDLLMLLVKILQNFPKVLHKYQKLFTTILVDEYQDTNPAQYTLLKLLAVHHNLFVVGDDAQSIYGFRGSDIRNILSFEQDFPESQVIKLEQNYRSTQNILAAAQKVIELNPEQKPKTLWTQNSPGEKIFLAETEDERAEAQFTAKKIIALATGQNEEVQYEPEEDSSQKDGSLAGYSILDRFLKARKLYGKNLDSFRSRYLPQLPAKHDSLREFCILYRTHAQSRALEEVLIESAIPYQIVGGLKFYERKEIKDMLAYLRIALNFRDLVSLKRVINEPPRGIGDKSYQIIREFILKLGGRDKDVSFKDFRADFAEIKLQPKAWQAAQDFFAMLEAVSATPKQATLPELMKVIVKKIGYEKYLRDGSKQGESRWENVEELFTVANKFKNLAWREGAERLLEEVALLNEIDSKDEKKDSVVLMTLHSAKGLEFDNVFFVGMEEGILPHSRSMLDPKELSEEVRLAYVGLTRARKRLFLIYARARRIFGQFQSSRPSRFLKVLPRDRINFIGSSDKTLFASDGEGEITVEEMEF